MCIYIYIYTYMCGFLPFILIFNMLVPCVWLVQSVNIHYHTHPRLVWQWSAFAFRYGESGDLGPKDIL